jgi:hypothetical protein
MGDADELHAADAADIGGKQLRAPPGLAVRFVMMLYHALRVPNAAMRNH